MAELRALLEMRQALPLSFSDDGGRLLVGSNIPGTQQLYELPVRGGELRQLTDFADPVSGQLLPDGRVLLERDEGGNERTQLYLLGDGLEPLALPGHVLAAGLAQHPATDRADQPALLPLIEDLFSN